MIQPDTRIPLAYQSPDFVGSMGRGAQLGQFVNEARHQNALRGALSEHGAGLVAGDPNARNALAGFDPGMVMQADAHRQGMQQNEQKMQLAFQQASQKAVELSSKLSAEQRAGFEAEASRFIEMLASAQTPEQFQQIMALEGAAGAIEYFTGGLPPTWENRGVIISAGLGAVEAMKLSGQPDDEMTTAVQTLHQRAVLAGRQPGTPEYKEFMETGGAQNGLSFTVGPDGSIVFNQGPGVTQRLSDMPAPSSMSPGGIGDLSPGAQFQNAGDAFGAGGVARGVVNRVADVLSGSTPFPRTMEAQRDFAVFGESLINAFASAYGRQPPSWLLKNIEELTPRQGSLWEGRSQAQAKLRSMARDLETRRNSLVRVADGADDPAFLENARRQIAGIDATIVQIQSALEGFQSQEGSSGTAGGIRWEIVD